jgi:hypothetical protein
MDIITIDNSTIVTGATSVGKFLVCNINDKQAAIPLFKFTYSDPELDFITPETDVEIEDGTVYETATSYGAGVSLIVNTSSCCIPLYRVPQNEDLTVTTKFINPLVVSNMSSTGYFFTVKVDDDIYGVPIYHFSTVYPFTQLTAMSSVDITTEIGLGIPTKDVCVDSRPSTNLNSKIQRYSHLITRIKNQLGYPLIQLEICDDGQLCDFIDLAIEWYTKYAGYSEEYLIFNSELYEEPGLPIDRLITITPTLRAEVEPAGMLGYDYDLDDYRKVISVFEFRPGESTGINTLFTLEHAMAQQTYFSYMLGNVGFDLVTWECLKQWLDQREKSLAQIHYVDFDNRNQLLRLIPRPRNGQQFYGVVGCYVELPIRDLIKERWVQQYALALTKIAIGNVRGKYAGTQLFGGGTINYNDLLSQGLTEKEKLETELMRTYGEAPARFFVG